MGRKLNLDFTGVDSYSKATEGIHTAKVAEITEKETQSGDPMLQFIFEVTKGESRGCKVFENFVLTDKALWKLKQFLQAIGMQANGKLKLDLDKLIGRVVDIEVFHDEYNGQTRAKISDYYKAGGNAASSDDDDEEEDDEEEPAPKKKPAAKGKKKPEPDPDDEEEDDDTDDDEEDDEEEEPAPKKKKQSKPAPAQKQGRGRPPKKKAADPDEDEDSDDDDEWEEDN